MAWGSPPLRNTTESDYTWDFFLSLVKSGSHSTAKSFLPFLVRSFSESGISNDCENTMIKFMLNFIKWETWAVRMVDASGKIPSGILEGTVMDFGSYDECLKIKVVDSSKYSDGKELFRGRYCMVGLHSPLLRPLSEKTKEGKNYLDAYGTPPDWAHEVLIRAGGYMKKVAFWFGACVPSTCTENDIRKIGSIVSKPLGFNVSLSDCQIDEPFIWPSYSIAAASCLGCLALLCAIGTLTDVICRWRKSNPTNGESDHVLLRIPKAFSILTNTEILFCGNVGGGSLACFNGIRFLSATWIILGHTYFYTDTWKYLKYRHLLGFEEQFNGYLPVAVMENFTIPVGSFFFMSGLLLVYTTWKTLEKNNGKLNLLIFIIHKFWRMTPALGLTIALFFCMPLIDSGPIWNSSLNPPLQQCQNLWWANFLFINNWWNTDQYCLIHTWYLAALMQFHIAGILLLLLVYRWPVIGVILGSMLTVACATITSLLVIWNNYPMPAPGLTKDMDVTEDFISRVYIKPFSHFTTYLVGMIIGYFILKFHDRKLSPKSQVVGWILAIAAALSSLYGLYGPAEHIAVRVLYIIGFRIGWALSIGWMTYVCATGIGGIINRLLSWSAMYPLGQLSYLTYLLHPLVIIYRNASLRERVYYGHTELVFSFFSNILVSFFLAYIGFVAVEMPFAILEKMIFKNRSKLNLKKEYKMNPQIEPSDCKTTNP